MIAVSFTLLLDYAITIPQLVKIGDIMIVSLGLLESQLDEVVELDVGLRDGLPDAGLAGGLVELVDRRNDVPVVPVRIPALIKRQNSSTSSSRIASAP